MIFMHPRRTILKKFSMWCVPCHLQQIFCRKLFNATEWHLLLQLICNNILAFSSLLVKKKIYPDATFIFADAGTAMETVRLNRPE